jgi:hypothetical protein
MKKIFFLFFLGLSISGFSQSRLDSIHIAHYDIHLNVTNIPSHQIAGFTTISVIPKLIGINTIHIDLQSLTVDSIIWNNNITAYFHASPDLWIYAQPLTPSDTQYITIYYHGTPVADSYWGGFFFTSTYAYNMGVGMASVPPSFGRCWFPCVDDFNDKATYTVSIETDPDKMAVCGGLLTDSETLNNGNKWWEWTLSDPIPTYLASIAVGPFIPFTDTIHLENGTIPIEIYGTTTQISLIPGSFQYLKTVIRGFESCYGAYMWQRIGYVLIPFNSGAMEHATNIGYPYSSVNGTTANQSLYIHELSHSWFGNLLTCSEPATMWINEGFARYSELVADQILDTSNATFKENFRILHRSVIKNAHIDDGDYYALDNVPQSATYGTTTYDKGGIVAHSLRGYLGDSLFFNGLKVLFAQNKFGNVNSEQFFQKLSIITGVDLTDFYLGWVHQPGFLHFSLDSIIPLNQQDGYILSMKQKLYHATEFADQNKVDIAFYSNSGDSYLVENVTFSGESDYVQVTIPFQPDFWILDPNEKLSDAVIDYWIHVPEVSIVNCNDANFKLKSITGSDTSIYRVEHNLCKPDPVRVPNTNIYRISETHYWKIESIESHINSGEFQFKYASSGTNSADGALLQNYTKEYLILLYRRNATQDWQIVTSSVTGNQYTGQLITTHILPGEYTFGIGLDEVRISESSSEKPVEIYPNPATNFLFYHIHIQNWNNATIHIYDINGKWINSVKCYGALGQIDISSLQEGHYLVKIINEKGEKWDEKFTKLK